MLAAAHLCFLQIDPSAGCSVTSDQIEQNYNRNQHGSMDFYTPKYTYRLDFSGGIPQHTLIVRVIWILFDLTLSSVLQIL